MRTYQGWLINEHRGHSIEPLRETCHAGDIKFNKIGVARRRYPVAVGLISIVVFAPVRFGFEI